VVSILTALTGIGISFAIVNDQAGAEFRRSAQRQCLKGKLDQGAEKWKDQNVIDLWESGCPGPESYMSSNELTKMRAELPADYMQIFMPAFGLGVVISLAVAAIPLLVFWTVGWIAAGFTRF
jgi:hypothetical protein